VRGYVSVEGALQIGRPTAATFSWFEPFAGGPQSFTRPAYTNLIGQDPSTDGVVLARSYYSNPLPIVDTSKAATSQMTMPLPTVRSRYSVTECPPGPSPPLLGQYLEIRDGSPQDLHNAMGRGVPDGKIDLCFEHLFADGRGGGALITDAPTTIYITGKSAQGIAIWLYDSYAIEPGHPVPSRAPLIPDGMQIVVTEAPTGASEAGYVGLEIAGRFSGSIYAPQSVVFVGGSSNPNIFNPDPRFQHVDLGNVVARFVYFGPGGTSSWPIGQNTDSSSNDSVKPTLTSWTTP